MVSTEIEIAILIFILILKRLQISKTTLKKQKSSRGLTPLGFKTFYKAAVIKTLWYSYKDRHRKQCNRVAQKQTLAYTAKRFLTKLPRPFSEEKTVFSTNSAEHTEHLHAKG